MSKSLRKRYSYIYLLPVIVMYSIFIILPNVIGLFMGFTDWSTYDLFTFNFTGIENFKQMQLESTVFIAIKNTLYFTFFTVIVKNVLGFIIAYIVNMNLKIKNYLRSVTFLPMIISPVVIAVVFIAIYQPETGILNSFLRMAGLGAIQPGWLTDTRLAMTSICLSDVWSGTGFCMIIYLAGMQSVPKEYIESAKIDGASNGKQMRHIILPLILQSATVNIMLSFISGLKVFGQVYTMTNGGPADSTQVIQTLIYRAFSQGRLGYASALGLLFTLIVGIFSLLLVVPMRKREVEY